MDLIEIRKKAREKKEAEEKAAREAAAAAESGAKEAAPEAPAEAPAVEAAAPKRKRVRKAVKPPEPEAGRAAEEAPEAVTEEPEPEPAAPEEEWPEEPDEQWLDEAMKAEAAKAEAEAEPVPAAPAEPHAPSAPPEPEITAGKAEEPGEQEEEVKEEDRIREYLAFMLSGEEYAVKVEAVKEIIRLQQITKVPRAEDFVEGIISLRGVIIPVYDIKKRLGLDVTERQRSVRIVIISGDGSLQGIIVDRVTGVARLREGAIEPPPAVIGGVEGEYLEGVGRIGERLLILFNTERVLSLDSGVEY